jgi:HK97 family phage major capsid protein/HK97 family phage prohead protease
VPRRAYSLLTVKSLDDDKRILTGRATSVSTDSYGDVVEPSGAQFTLPLPLLWQHNASLPIGEVIDAVAGADGIDIVARIARTDTPGTLKDRLDTAWESLKLGLVKGLSIGFSSIEESYDKSTGGFHFTKWAWRELSAVTIPANTDATIHTIRAASGPSPSPGASGSLRVSTRRVPSAMKKTYADLIAECVATRKEKTDRIDALLTKAGDAGVTLDAAEAEQHDTIAGEITALDQQLDRYRAAEAREKAAAAAVPALTSTDGTRSVVSRVTVERPLPPGIQFARYAMCMGLARGNPYEAKQLAKDNYGDHSAALVKLIERTAVGAAATSVTGWASELVPYNIMDDFIEYLRPRTILGKFGTNGVPDLRRVGFNTRTSGFSAGFTANWVGEGLPVPLSKAVAYTMMLTWAKLEALAVLTKEEMRFSNPSAEAKVRDDLTRAIIQKQDKDFIDPAKGPVANVSPASITYQTVPIPPSGTTGAALRSDLAALMTTFANALLDPSDIVLIMSTVDALNLSLMLNTLGVPVFPGVTMQGGNLLGFPVITSEALVSIGSPIERIIVAVKAGDIYLADDGVVTVDASDQASVEMSDAPTQNGITGSGASMVSFWQAGLVGLKAMREITWKLRRTGAARYLGPCLYAA